jgi:glycosyltransferase involved in cell wall biosynthesis
MKILILIQCTNLGGMEQSTLLFIRELIRIGIQVEVLSLNSVGDIGPALEKEGVTVKGIPYRGKFGWRSYFRVRRALRESDADHLVMVGHNLMAMLAMGSLWKGKRVLSLHFHHRGVMPLWCWGIIYVVAAFKFKAIIYPSKFIHQEALQIAPWIRARSNVISFPIPMNEVTSNAERAQARARLGLLESGFYVGNAGWLISRKRWDVFLKVAARVLQKLPQARFLIAGDGPERDSLESLARDLGIEAHVRWMGWQKGVDDFYKALNVMLFNSDWDAMGRTPLEAMSHGVATVASVANGGLGEIIVDKRMGFFLREHDVEKMADEIIRIASDSKVAESYAQAGNQRIKEVGSAKLHTIRVLLSLGITPPQWYLAEPDDS